MTRRSKVWLVVVVLFLIADLGGAVVAAAGGELLHAGLHVALLLPGAYLLSRLASRRAGRRIEPGEEAADTALPSELTDRLTHLEQSLDAAAIEIERVGEGQRFMTRLFAEQGTPRASGEGAAEPEAIDAWEATHHGPRS